MSETNPNGPADARAFIAASRWQRAWSAPGRFLPHEYTLRTWHVEGGTEPDFLAMVRLIRTLGYVEHFGRRRRMTYLRVDGWRYWMMSPPERPLADVLEASTLINRCEVDERGRPTRGPKWLREGVQPDTQTRMEV
jgi:hypothetical protein